MSAETHRLEAAFDNGFPDKPAWHLVCECSWETWDNDTKEGAAEEYADHVRLNAGIAAYEEATEAMGRAETREHDS